MNANSKNRSIKLEHKNLFLDRPVPRYEIKIDHRFLFGLFTHVYHWNNIEAGSQFTFRRFPERFVREAQRFLNFLTL